MKVHVVEMYTDTEQYVVGVYENLEYAKLAGLVEECWIDDDSACNIVRTYDTNTKILDNKMTFYLESKEKFDNSKKIEKLYSSGDFHGLYTFALGLVKDDK